VGALRTLEAFVTWTFRSPAFELRIGGFAVMALLLSAAGLYGLLGFLVARRMRRSVSEWRSRGSGGYSSPGHGKGLRLTAAGLSIGLVMGVRGRSSDFHMRPELAIRSADVYGSAAWRVSRAGSSRVVHKQQYGAAPGKRKRIRDADPIHQRGNQTSGPERHDEPDREARRGQSEGLSP